MTELKPCPFCGGNKIVYFPGDEPDDEEGFPTGIPAFMRCEDCKAQSGPCPIYDPAGAEMVWNERARRALSPAVREFVEAVDRHLERNSLRSFEPYPSERHALDAARARLREEEGI